MGLLARAGAQIQLRETEMAMGDERTHAPRLGEGQGLAVGLLGLAEEPESVGLIASLMRRAGGEAGHRRPTTAAELLAAFIHEAARRTREGK